jgi:acyl-[acyl-carrier-protein]-phospholipid O-acyltransferase / long-chain-fatty-acid--[acyl-carrier-protein] ligase
MSNRNQFSLLRQRRFAPFFWTQFLGAFNDNVYKNALVILFAFQGAALTSIDSDTLINLSAGLFILPFFLFSATCGQIADKYEKGTLIQYTVALEIVLMILGAIGFYFQNLTILLISLFLGGVQSTLFGPVKYSFLPQHLSSEELTGGNGLVEMGTFVAILLGTILGGILISVPAWGTMLVSLTTIGVATLGWLLSRQIPHSPAPDPTLKVNGNAFSETANIVQLTRKDRTVFLSILGISWFWCYGSLFLSQFPNYSKEVLGGNEQLVTLFLTCFSFGIGIGSLLCERLSGHKVEMGLVPLGALGLTWFGIDLFFATPAKAEMVIGVATFLQTFTGWRIAADLFFLGLFGGFFIVPLYALIQFRSDPLYRSRIIAGNNIINALFMVLAAVLAVVLLKAGLTIPQLLLASALFNALVAVYIFTLVPEFFVRFSLWLLTHTIYRIRIIGQEHVPLRGPALLICNHMSFVDGLLVGGCVQRFIRFLVYRPIYEQKALNWFMRLMNAIPVESGNRKVVVESLERAREQLRQGHVVCIFAEGAISRTGNLLPFKRGFEKIMQGLDNVPIIPVHLDRLWGSVFSFDNGRFFWKRPKRLPYPVTVSFGAPLPSTATAVEVRHAIAELGSAAVDHRRTKHDLLHLRFIDTAKRCWFSFCMADSTGRELTYGKTLIGSLLLARWLQRHRPQEQNIGLILPASVGGALANVATLLAGKVPVNLNFTTGREAMELAIEQSNLHTILTSRTFLSKAKLEEREGMVFVEDLLKDTSSAQRVWTALVAFLTPRRVLQRLWNRPQQKPDSLATIIFSSGSTGAPKGVMLSHHNILSNVESMQQIFTTSSQDCVMGSLPFFHSFGFTGTLWLPLVASWQVVYHPNPLDAKTLGEMVQKYRATVLISTPTFYATYLRKCSAEEFASLRYAIAGAEKLRPTLAHAFREQYGIDLLEGYGCTEMSPAIAVNVPDVKEGHHSQIGLKLGSVGHPIPGVVAKVVDRETNDPLPIGQEGLLLVKGPNRMLGYLGQPEKTREVIRDGWYVTGDIAKIDDDGFIYLTDRLSRFSKIGGEMVPHLRIEETIQQILGDTSCVVTAIPDEQKGERLVVLYTHTKYSPDALWAQLNQTDLPKLWVPKREHFFAVETIPVLGTGKVDLRAARVTALTLTTTEVVWQR